MFLEALIAYFNSIGDTGADKPDGNKAFGSHLTSRWVSEGITTNGNRGHYELVDSINPATGGEGYFVSKLNGMKKLPDLDSYSDVSATTFTVTLKSGWNAVANPYSGNVKLSSVKVQKGSNTPVSWTDATTNGWINNAIYYYKGSDWGSTYTFQSAGGNPDATLVPWMGYWVYVKKTDDIYKLIVTKP